MSYMDYKEENITERAKMSPLWKELEKQNGDTIPYLLERYLLLENWKRVSDIYSHSYSAEDEINYLHLLLANATTVILNLEERVRILESDIGKGML